MRALYQRPRDRLLASVLRDCRYVFEPIVRMRDRTPIAYEALLRPSAGCMFRTADEIFGLSKRIRAARDLDDLATAKAVRQFASLHVGPDSILFYNLHNRALDEPQRGPVGGIFATTDRAPPVCLEISEQTRIDPDRFERHLARWEKRPRIALDDFGTGQSNISRLITFRPDYAKIDRYFLAGIETDPRVASRLARIVDLVHDSDAVVIVEGIETERAFTLCAAAGCDLAQGYLFGPALAPPDPSPPA